MSKSIRNLKAAFAGESQANRRYLAFAIKAEKEGMANVGKLFRAVAEAETVHAHSHLNILEGVKTTKENLQAAMYPNFIKTAEEEDRTDADRTFNWANTVEKIHQTMYEKALGIANEGKDIEPKEYFVCQACGNTVEGGTPERCPICGMPRDHFKKV